MTCHLLFRLDFSETLWAHRFRFHIRQWDGCSLRKAILTAHNSTAIAISFARKESKVFAAVLMLACLHGFGIEPTIWWRDGYIYLTHRFGERSSTELLGKLMREEKASLSSQPICKRVKKNKQA